MLRYGRQCRCISSRADHMSGHLAHPSRGLVLSSAHTHAPPPRASRSPRSSSQVQLSIGLSRSHRHRWQHTARGERQCRASGTHACSMPLLDVLDSPKRPMMESIIFATLDRQRADDSQPPGSLRPTHPPSHAHAPRLPMRIFNPLSTLSEDVMKDNLYLTNAEAAAAA